MNVLCFGAGVIGKLYSDNKPSDITILAFVDNNPTSIGKQIGSIPIVPPQAIENYSYDKIIITVTTDEKSAHEIYKQLLSFGISGEKIEFVNFSDFYPYVEDTYVRCIWLRGFASYVYSHGLEGKSVAECGVYRGSYARYINKYFADKKLYLFDTFEGFDENDLIAELNLNNPAFTNSIIAKNRDTFSNTSVERVMRFMPYPDNCVIKQGHFPASAANVHDTFCFVSLDMDLYEPMLAGLKFFWDKMADGGVMLLHDYFHPQLLGVKQAVLDFEKYLQKPVCKTTIGDFSSIAIIKN